MVFDNNMNKLIILFVIGIVLLVGINFYKKKIGDQYSTILSIIVIVVCGYFGYMVINEHPDVRTDVNNELNMEVLDESEMGNGMGNEMGNGMGNEMGNEDIDEELMEEFANSKYEEESPTTMEHFEDKNEDEVKALEKLLKEAIVKNDLERAVELVRKISELKGKTQTQIETDAKTMKNLMDAKRKDVFNSKEFLPKDKNSIWSKNCPDGQGGIGICNLLNSGHHLGINTQGCSMRNSNRGIRSEPHNPQKQVSPWMQTTICPDLFRKSLDG
jgi:hypothetical protein